MAPLVLIIDDEPDLVAGVAHACRRDGFAAEGVGTGPEALARLERDPLPDIVLLDLMLPGLGGVELCRRLKDHPRTADLPVIMLTARSEERSRVAGFDAGADDYVVKPFSSRELLLRIRAVLRRAGKAEEPVQGLAFGILRLDPGAHRAWVGREEAPLTAQEFRLLRLFVERRGRVQSRERLIDEVWEESPPDTPRTVDTTIKRLRQKLGPAGAYLETVRGVGYRFLQRPPPEDG